jgi:hypothetical protein
MGMGSIFQPPPFAFIAMIMKIPVMQGAEGDDKFIARLPPLARGCAKEANSPWGAAVRLPVLKLRTLFSKVPTRDSTPLLRISRESGARALPPYPQTVERYTVCFWVVRSDKTILLLAENGKQGKARN